MASNEIIIRTDTVEFPQGMALEMGDRFTCNDQLVRLVAREVAVRDDGSEIADLTLTVRPWDEENRRYL